MEFLYGGEGALNSAMPLEGRGNYWLPLDRDAQLARGIVAQRRLGSEDFAPSLLLSCLESRAMRVLWIPFSLALGDVHGRRSFYPND